MHPMNFTKIRENIIKMIQFGIVGGLMIILNVEILYILTNFLGIYYIISAILSYLLLTALSFSLNEKWTFNSVTHHAHENPWHRLATYYLVSISGMNLNIIILFLLTEFGNVYYLYSSIIASLLVFFWNFSLNKKITWREKQGL
jgi:dolichol-phosphate mannosyltransferase